MTDPYEKPKTKNKKSDASYLPLAAIIIICGIIAIGILILAGPIINNMLFGPW